MEVLYVDQDASDERIDSFLSSVYEDHSRSFFQKLIKAGNVLVNGKTVKAGYQLDTDDEIRIDFPEPVELKVEAEDIPLNIVYEDSDVILIDKPKDMVVHPAAGHMTGTIVNGLLYHCKDLSGINGVLRPGIVHRIDKDTTGIIIACKNDASHNSISAQLKEHSIKRRYYALVHGRFPEKEGTVSAPIGRHKVDRKKMAVVPDGKEAVTHFTVLEEFSQYSLVECRLETGRTHQIRVHMSHIGHPLVGDTVYGSGKSPFKTEGQCLHAYLLGFVHPKTGEYLEFTSPLPAYFEKILSNLRRN